MLNSFDLRKWTDYSPTPPPPSEKVNLNKTLQRTETDILSGRLGMTDRKVSVGLIANSFTNENND
jgi:hypothetical protein